MAFSRNQAQQKILSYYEGSLFKKEERKQRPRFNPETFATKVTDRTDPQKLASAIARALVDGCVVEVEAAGESALARLLLALALAEAFTEENGGTMKTSFSGVDLKAPSVAVKAVGTPKM